MRDDDKLLTIAQTYSFIKGRFTSKQLYSFILSHNFKFRSGFTTREIGRQLSRSRKFNKIEENHEAKYEAIE